VPLALPDGGSVFVVFQRPARERHLVSTSARDGAMEIVGRSESGAQIRLWHNERCMLQTSHGRQIVVDAPVMPESLRLTGPWKVRFTPGWGAPESVTFHELVPWDQHPDDGIKHFSGTATYRISFPLSKQQVQGIVRLQLGDVRHLARVRLNGEDAGVRWTAPWTADLTGAATCGVNTLEVDVTNVWANRLIGDAALPENRRFTNTNILLEAGDRTVRPYRGYGSTDPLVTSGLLGPVRVEFGQRREVRF
jgi:hypothetical protein